MPEKACLCPFSLCLSEVFVASGGFPGQTFLLLDPRKSRFFPLAGSLRAWIVLYGIYGNARDSTAARLSTPKGPRFPCFRGSFFLRYHAGGLRRGSNNPS